MNKIRFKRKLVKGIIPKQDTVEKETQNKCYINLSSATITEDHAYLFYLGDSFSPTPKLPDPGKFPKDLEQWSNKLRTAYNYSQWNFGCDTNQDPQIRELERNVVKSNNKYNCNEKKNHALELFLSKVKADALGTHQRRNYVSPDNLTKGQRKALNEMSKWTDKVIRPFDKGSGYFILDLDDYIKRVNEHLDDAETYIEIHNKPEAIKEVIQTVIQWTEDYKDEKGMTKKVKNWIIPTEEQKPGNMYCNPKAHKPEKNYPGRLISTGCDTYIKNLSILTSHELKKVPLKYNLKDTNALLRNIEDINKKGTLKNFDEILHVTFDVEAMFPSIPLELGMQECKKLLDKRKDPIFSTECILEAIKITLKHNLTEFNGRMFRQDKGTGIGPNNACDYADTAMTYVDELIFNALVGWLFLTGLLLPFYARFRDDIYIPWVYGLENLLRFNTWLNGIHPNLKFTMSKPSLEGTEFLETYIYHKEDNILHTRVHSKPCDTHSFLVPTSCHATHIFENIPKGVAHRLFRISSEHINYEKSKHEFTDYLKARGYNENLVHESFREIEKSDRLALLNNKPKEDIVSKQESRGQCYPLVMDFNPASPNIASIINKYKHVLDMDTKLSKIIPSSSVFVSFRRARNIIDQVVHSKLKVNKINTTNNYVNILPDTFNDNINSDGKCNRCKNKKCVLHEKYLKVTDEFTSYHTTDKFKVGDYLDCNSKAVIYLLNCKICKKSNVGYTTNSMKERFRTHKNHIKMDRNNCAFTKHFTNNKEIHPIDKSSHKSYDATLSKIIEVTIIEKVKLNDSDEEIEIKNKCLAREAYWQKKLKTMEKYGV